ncbi:hypothetical protein F6X40_27395 [Paraburkholderia sp. UCT31]|uniref:hypothetical protein n=1 Tax=Paraburkholderia sp. UCT31 TaxID=2615209 RepID=UPI001655D94C|nr:hypothetical protein [Paraburkholderia sp. UCT31]MBC8740386.1 hypothetical protein [Paraburkholderia sp. UCT31]
MTPPAYQQTLLNELAALADNAMKVAYNGNIAGRIRYSWIFSDQCARRAVWYLHECGADLDFEDIGNTHEEHAQAFALSLRRRVDELLATYGADAVPGRGLPLPPKDTVLLTLSVCSGLYGALGGACREVVTVALRNLDARLEEEGRAAIVAEFQGALDSFEGAEVDLCIDFPRPLYEKAGVLANECDTPVLKLIVMCAAYGQVQRTSGGEQYSSFLRNGLRTKGSQSGA